jgi:hypothetical protein
MGRRRKVEYLYLRLVTTVFSHYSDTRSKLVYYELNVASVSPHEFLYGPDRLKCVSAVSEYASGYGPY